MEQVGIFTLCLQTVRRLWGYIPKIFGWLCSFEGGLLSELILILIIFKIVPVIVEVIIKICNAIIWLVKKFE